MPAGQPKAEFSLEADRWKPWPEVPTDLVLYLLASLPSASVTEPGAKVSGLRPGERALAAAAVARALGCRSLAASEARRAAEALKAAREVQVLLEEGLPSPLTGRLGAVITAAGALARSPAILSGRDLHRLDGEKFDAPEIVDLILAAAVASWTARITLGLGRPATD